MDPEDLEAEIREQEEGEPQLSVFWADFGHRPRAAFKKKWEVSRLDLVLRPAL